MSNQNTQSIETSEELSVLRTLKEKTKLSHQKAEKSNLARFIIDHSITSSQYKELLEKNYRIYSAIENYLHRNSGNISDSLIPFISLDKSEALAKDLKARNKDLPISKNTIDLSTDEASMIGAMYVIEGSMLGGLLIAKHVNNCKNLNNTEPHYFFGGNPKSHTIRWKNFCEEVEKLNLDQDQIDQSVDTAIKVFQYFE